MHRDSDFTDPPPRRIGALALLTSATGHVLLVEKAYKSGPDRFGLPGGCARPGEEVPVACQREVREETGLSIVPQRVLVVHQMPANGPATEGINVVFDGGEVPAAATITVPLDELTGYRWVPPAYLDGMVAPYTRWRILTALRALEGGPVRYLCGHPTDAR